MPFVYLSLCRNGGPLKRKHMMTEVEMNEMMYGVRDEKKKDKKENHHHNHVHREEDNINGQKGILFKSNGAGYGNAIYF